ncbi:unnamed protein product [Anisakis simplex]|uniref:SSD domain-containing protein n=1 Tax=Anisakis simplex TaxID=6269 RepID=A0A0M3KEF2_ANISI|nr:unnamed protein product [Anisakis simplex]
MLGAWRWSDTKLSVEERLAVTMSDAGASITATSFTNFVDSVIVIEISCWNTSLEPFMHRLFGTKYAPFILRKDVMVVSWVLFFAYATLAIYGCSSIAVDISPKKYVRDNSPIQTFVHLADKYIWADNVMPIFYVMKPPDLRNARARARLNELVYRLEHTKYSIGRVSTSFWLWEYQRFLNDFPDIDYETEFYDQKHLSDFFAQFDYKQYREFVKIKENSVNGEPCIAAFSFQTSFYGLDSWNKREVELFHWRRILSDYTEFDVVLAGILSPFLIDQRHNIAPSSMQAIGSAIAIMGFISVFFLPDKVFSSERSRCFRPDFFLLFDYLCREMIVAVVYFEKCIFCSIFCSIF